MAGLNHPWVLLAVPVLLALGWWQYRRPRPFLGIPDGMAAEAAAGRGLAWLPEACRLAGLLVAVVALAGPTTGPQRTLWKGRGVDVMLALDLSESMAALDWQWSGRTVSRLQAITALAKRFAASRPGDRLGLVVFGSRAYTVMPPTDDHAAVSRALDALTVGAAGKRTALGDALGLCLKRLRHAPGKSRVILVLSDGRSNAGELRPETAARLAADAGVTIYAIGVGSRTPAPFLLEDPQLGPKVVYTRADSDEATLRAMARATGGRFWQARDTRNLNQAIRAIDALEPSDRVVIGTARTGDSTPRLLTLAVGLLTAAAGLSASRFARLP